MTTNIARPGETRKRVMAFISEFYAQHYRPPTLREIQASTGIQSISNVAFHLDRLVDEGALHRSGEGKHRAYIPQWAVSAIKARASFEVLKAKAEVSL